ncbi:MAG: hypothetical protein QW291_08700 [Thermofilaceae archaeon]
MIGAREDPVDQYASSRIVLFAVEVVVSVINSKHSITVAEKKYFSALRKVLLEGSFNTEKHWLICDPEKENFPLDSIAGL